jgi:hypothetical protein
MIEDATFTASAFAGDEQVEGPRRRFGGIFIVPARVPVPVFEALGDVGRFLLPTIFQGTTANPDALTNAEDFVELREILGRPPTLREAETWLGIQHARITQDFEPLLHFAIRCGDDLAAYHDGRGAFWPAVYEK